MPSPDDLWYVIPWFDHMIHAKYVRPYESAAVPRYTPGRHRPGHGRRGRLVGRVDHGQDHDGGRAQESVRGRRRPKSQGAASPGPDVSVIPRDVDAAGDTLYQTYCAVCHGSAGDAKGPVSSRIGAPSLLTGRARGYSDGYVYSIIRYGRGVMPRYGDKVYLPSDRWAIVNHVRKLQGQSPLGPEPAGAAVGIPPGPSATGSTGERPR